GDGSQRDGAPVLRETKPQRRRAGAVNERRRRAEAHHARAGETPICPRAAGQVDFRVGIVWSVVRFSSAGGTGCSGCFRDGGGDAFGRDGGFSSNLGSVEIYGLGQSKVSGGRGGG